MQATLDFPISQSNCSIPTVRNEDYNYEMRERHFRFRVLAQNLKTKYTDTVHIAASLI